MIAKLCGLVSMTADEVERQLLLAWDYHLSPKTHRRGVACQRVARVPASEKPITGAVASVCSVFARF
jgi:hypothetical protein